MKFISALLVLGFSSACSSAIGEGASAQRDDDLSKAVASVPTLSFNSNWTMSQSGTPLAGSPLKIAYDASRATCTGETDNGEPGYSVNAHWKLKNTVTGDLTVLGHVPAGTLDPTFTVPAVVLGSGAPSGDLQVWFEDTSMFGCQAWDSNFGANYHVNVSATKEMPDWMGNAWVVLDREDCNGQACAGHGSALTQGFNYDTWVIERAAIRQVSFEIYEPTVTDWNDPDTWKKLDVRLYSRVGSTGPFSMRYINLAGHVGNNASYVQNLTDLQPFSSFAVAAANCPAFPYQVETDGTVQADVQFYFQANGVDLRPQDGTVFHGTYSGYASNYAACTPSK